MKKMGNMENKGFTLIELLVVIFIIGTLTGIILPNYLGARQRARDTQRKQDLQEIKTALRLYYNDHQSYPAVDDFSFGAAWGDYMTLVSQDPLGEERSYGYCVSADGEAFLLWASLENAGDSEIAASASRCPGSICTSSCDTNCYYVCAD